MQRGLHFGPRQTDESLPQWPLDSWDAKMHATSKYIRCQDELDRIFRINDYFIYMHIHKIN